MAYKNTIETIKATVEKIIYSSDSGFKVLKGRTNQNKAVVITGDFGPELIIDTIADFHGSFRTHPKYGLNFRSSKYEITYNAEELLSIQIFIDTISPNIGSERAKLIVGYFGVNTIRILDEEPQRLCEVEGIGKISAGSLEEAWKENRKKWFEERKIYSLRAFLVSLGIKERRIKRILSHFGGGFEAEETIRENPYILSDVEGFGFTTTDHIAEKLGISPASINRFEAFLYYTLESICPFYGHLYFEIKDISSIINKYCSEFQTKFINKEKIEIEDILKSLKKLEEENKIKIDNTAVYSKNNYIYEQRSAEILTKISTKKSDLIFLNQEAIENYIETFEKENQINLSYEQRKALELFAEQKVFIITGSPGTGKTTILKAIVELARKLHLHLTCLTPTGISAKKLATTVNYDAYTIHRRLGYRGNIWTNNEQNPYKTDILIIDECSMIDQEVFYRLMLALEDRTHIVFVGDHDQLPSVGAGNVLRDLIASEIPVIKLEKIFRQSEASDIIQVAHRIKEGDSNLDSFSNSPKSDVFFLRMNDPKEIEKIIVTLTKKFKNEKRAFQLITPRNEGPLGVNPLNTLLQEVLNPPSENKNEMKLRDYTLRKGDRVIITKNDYQNNIYNGDIGKIVFISSGNVCIEIDDQLVELSADEIEGKVKLAYIISVHKSQGLEYPYIILPMINQFGKLLLQRNLLYTAITRAKEKVIILGHGSALEKAIKNASVSKRNTRLGERIRLCLQQKRKGFLPQLLLEQENSPDATNKKELPLYKEGKFYPMVSIEKS